MGGNGIFHRWKISLHRSQSSATDHLTQHPSPHLPPLPELFICPICRSFMSDPVVVASGQTFDRLCVQVCQDLRYLPTLPDGTTPDFSTVIPNIVFRSTIATWCQQNDAAGLPPEPDYATVERIVRRLMTGQKPDDVKVEDSDRELIAALPGKPCVNFSRAHTELAHRVDRFYSSSSSSNESVIARAPATPLVLATRPACLSLSSSISGEGEGEGDGDGDGGDIYSKLTSRDVYDQEQGVISLRKMTRSDESSRLSLCTARLLSALKPLLGSRYVKVQSNAAAAAVNLSLEKSNKVKIVRSGLVPSLINVLTGGFPESQEHAAGALFSLALENDNKTVIGVLGALQPLLHALRSESERTRHDSAMALYHLSHVQNNRVKLVRLGAVPVLLGMLRTRSMTGRVLLVLWNLANCVEGRSAMLCGNAVEVLVQVLREGDESESTRENCVAALYALSNGELRFRVMAEEAGVLEVLEKVVVGKGGSERAREKARRILAKMRKREGGGEEEEAAGWLTRGRGRGGGGGGGGGGDGPRSTEF